MRSMGRVRGPRRKRGLGNGKRAAPPPSEFVKESKDRALDPDPSTTPLCGCAQDEGGFSFTINNMNILPSS